MKMHLKKGKTIQSKGGKQKEVHSQQNWRNRRHYLKQTKAFFNERIKKTGI